VLSGIETFKAKGVTHHNAKSVESLKGYQLGNFKIIPFDLKHDVPCFGYIIDNPDMGRLVFITDTFLCKYKFPDVNHWLIEANYSDEILERSSSPYKNRVYTSHLSIDTAKGILKSNNLSKTGIIILCHLSDGHSNEREFIKQIQEEFGVISVVADKGLTVNLTSVC
jgi:ribonuclease BN (tRNA processing enzyme)